ncbi:MAG: hypothetical protein DWB42_19650 [Chloroflexi bacterium]|nr:hypothetical protein [Chloroflexota bacterium]
MLPCLWCLQLAHRKNSETFIAFLEHLAFTVYPNQRLILVLDNASYHHSRASYHHSRATTAALAALEDRVLVIWLPKYSPFLNPIERFWLYLKNLVAANYLHPDLDALFQAIDQTITNQNTPNQPQRLTFVDNLRLVA